MYAYETNKKIKHKLPNYYSLNLVMEGISTVWRWTEAVLSTFVNFIWNMKYENYLNMKYGTFNQDSKIIFFLNPELMRLRFKT